MEKLDEDRNTFKRKVNVKIIPSIILHARYDIRTFREKLAAKLNDKLLRLSNEQEKPLFNVHGIVDVKESVGIKEGGLTVDQLGELPKFNHLFTTVGCYRVR